MTAQREWLTKRRSPPFLDSMKGEARMSNVSGFDLVSALADVHAEMKDFALALRRDPSWRDVQTLVTVNRYREDKLFIECYVDGERSDGRGFAWWLEAEWSMERWNVEGSLLEAGSAGSDTLEKVGPSRPQPPRSSRGGYGSP